MKRTKNIILFFILGFISLSTFWSRQIEIVVKYDVTNGEIPSGLTTLYFDNGDGFEEDDSVYADINSNQVSYAFVPGFWVNGVRIVPTRNQDQIVFLNNIDIYIDNVRTKTFNYQELYENIIQDQSAALVNPESKNIKIQYKENEPWPYLTFSNNFIDSINTISYMTFIRTIGYIAILLIPLIMGRIKKIAEPLRLDKKIVTAVFALGFIAIWFAQLILPNIVIAAIGFTPFLFVDIKKELEKSKISVPLCIITFLISAFLMPYTIRELNSQFSIFSICFVLNIWICIFSVSTILYKQSKQFGIEYNYNIVSSFLYAYAIVCVSIGIYEIMKNILIDSQNFLAASIASIERLTSPVLLMNCLWGTLFVLTIIGLFGRGMASVIYGCIFSIIFIGNIVKIHYHNTLLTPLDFLQIKEMFRIAYAMLGVKNILLIVGGIILSIGILLKLRHYLYRYFKWNKKYLVIMLVTSIPLFSLSSMVINGKYKELGIFYKGYENEFVNEQSDGVAFYNLINFVNLKEVIMKEPDNYTEEYVNDLKNQFANVVGNVENGSEKPNVILIMAESLFDIENIDEVTFNSSVMPTLKQYQKGTLISPRYGGYTSAVEYEALTGLTLAFYPSSLVPYTTYFNQKDKFVPSVVQEFNDNGYATYAVHPNVKTFYNRNVAYEMLGFQTFLDNTAFEFTENNVVAGQFLKDGPIGEKIISLIEENDEPIFTFAVTIAGHYMEENRYETTTIKAQSDKLSAAELNDLEQAATAYHETDEMFKNLVDYLENCNEPTLVYIFGDHLPPLPAFNKLDYTQSLYNKYGTFLAAYSNYKDISFPEYVTPNQLAPQMLIDSGVNYSSYYNYIYRLREQYPVIQKEFCNVDEIPEMQIYRIIQYDIMFGNQWFYEEK